MGSIVNITYVNKSMNRDLPKVFIFLKNEIPTFEALKDGVAWKVITDVGRNSSCKIEYPIETQVGASWNGGSCRTLQMQAIIGNKYSVLKDDSGITLESAGNAGNTRSIDVSNNIHVPDGVSVDLYKDDRVIMSKQIVAYGQKATFVLHPKLYWGIASEIQEGDQLSSAVLNSDSFFEQDLEGVSDVVIGLYGNAKDGYQFKIEDQR